MEFLLPHQVGVAVPGGIEAIVHTFRSFMDTNAESKGKVILKVDFRNAFNCVHRHIFLPIIHESFPSLFNWVQLCYGNPSVLAYGDELISSEEGVQQGDPLGPFLFCVVLKQLIRHLSAIDGIHINAWYLDDGCLLGEQSAIRRAIGVISREGPPLGLFLNKEKSELIFPNKDDCVSLEGIPSKSERVEILGSPVGDHKWCAEYANALLKKANTLLERGYTRLNHLMYNSFLYKSALAIAEWYI
jgi:hypothetical protein